VFPAASTIAAGVKNYFVSNIELAKASVAALRTMKV
jgi:hypothetical protein